MTTRGKIAALFLIGASTACAGDAPARFGGRSLVSSPLADTATLVEDWTVPLTRLSSPSQLSAMAVARDGRVVLAGPGATLYTVSEGRQLREVPVPPDWKDSDFTAVVIDSAGTIVIRDATRGRVGRATDSGQWDVLATVSPGGLLRGSQGLRVTQRGEVWVGIRPDDVDAGGGQPGPAPRPVYARLTGGSLSDTVRVPTHILAACASPDPHFRSGWFDDFRSRYLPFPQWTLSATGSLVAGCPADYAVEVAAGARRARTTRLQNWRPAGLGASEWADFKAVWTARMNLPAGGAPSPVWTWRGDENPTRKPAYASILPDEAGGFWVWTSEPSITSAANPTWPLAGLPAVLWLESGAGTFDVFDDEGRLVRHVRLPDGFRYTATPETPEPLIRGDTVWAVVTSPEGVELSRYRITAPGSAP